LFVQERRIDIDWLPAMALPDDDGISIKPATLSPSQPGRWHRKFFRGDLGEVVRANGDDSRDDTEAIQQADLAAIRFGQGGRPRERVANITATTRSATATGLRSRSSGPGRCGSGVCSVPGTRARSDATGRCAGGHS
jgi:hypothetical protein